MNACLLVLGMLAGCAPQPQAFPRDTIPMLRAAAPPQDRWVAEDKLRHFTMSFAVTAMGYGAARMVLDPEPAALASAGNALALGIGKEMFDVRSGAWFSFRDLVWDAAGVALGLALVHQIR